jgi:hypothetical protein
MIHPNEVHINLPTRPPVETWVQPPDEEGLLRAIAILGEIARVIHPVEGTFDLSGGDSLVDAVIGIITRHPMKEDELLSTLADWSPDQVKSTLAELNKSGQAQVVERYSVRFWSAALSHFPNQSKSQHTTQDYSRHRTTESIENQDY